MVPVRQHDMVLGDGLGRLSVPLSLTSVDNHMNVFVELQNVFTSKWNLD